MVEGAVVQALLAEFISVELGATVRVADAGFVSDELDEELDAIGVIDRRVDDEGTWGVQLAVSVVF